MVGAGYLDRCGSSDVVVVLPPQASSERGAALLWLGRLLTNEQTEALANLNGYARRATIGPRAGGAVRGCPGRRRGRALAQVLGGRRPAP